MLHAFFQALKRKASGFYELSLLTSPARQAERGCILLMCQKSIFAMLPPNCPLYKLEVKDLVAGQARRILIKGEGG